MKILMRIVSAAFIVMGAINGAIGGITVYGLQMDEVTDALAAQNHDYMQTVTAAGLMLVAAVFLLLAGVYGVRYLEQPGRFFACAVLGVLVLAMRVVLVVQNGIGSGTVLSVLLAVFWIGCEVLYLVLVFALHKQYQAAPPVEEPKTED